MSSETDFIIPALPSTIPAVKSIEQSNTRFQNILNEIPYCIKQAQEKKDHYVKLLSINELTNVHRETLKKMVAGSEYSIWETKNSVYLRWECDRFEKSTMDCLLDLEGPVMW